MGERHDDLGQESDPLSSFDVGKSGGSGTNVNPILIFTVDLLVITRRDLFPILALRTRDFHGFFFVQVNL